MSKQPILSLCIPTYNRAEILKETLERLVSDDGFDEDVEIVISDNCSTDNTSDVASAFIAKYPNIKYCKNEENVKIRNFFIALDKAEGRYLKLMNDTCSFQPNKLKLMKGLIVNSTENIALLFPAISYFVRKNQRIISHNINETLKYLSYNATWSPTFGIWKSDFHNICDNTNYETLMPQVDWIYRISSQKEICLFFDSYFDVKWTGSKGNYNYMQTFVVTYLGMLKQYDFKRWHYEVEKFRLLYILTAIYKKMVVSKTVSYSHDNALAILFKAYWYEPYFYVLFPGYFVFRIMYEDFLMRIFSKLRRIIR